MRLQTKIYAAIAAAFLLTTTVNWLWSGYTTARLERTVEAAKAEANVKRDEAARLETEAAEYKQKIQYLEHQLAEIQQLARKQDEELEKLNSISDRARANVERARRTRAAAATADELCQKLAELGHPCQ